MFKFKEPTNNVEFFDALVYYSFIGKKFDENISNLTIKKFNKNIILVEKESDEKSLYRCYLYSIPDTPSNTEHTGTVLKFSQSNFKLFDAITEIHNRRDKIYEHYTFEYYLFLLFKQTFEYKNEKIFVIESTQYPKSILEICNMINIPILDYIQMCQQRIKTLTIEDLEYYLPEVDKKMIDKKVITHLNKNGRGEMNCEINDCGLSYESQSY